LAGIGRLDSDHGRILDDAKAGVASDAPQAIAPAPLGAQEPRAASDITPDQREPNGEEGRPLGPMRLRPSTLRTASVDGNADGLVDPENLDDAIATTVHQICPTGRLVDPGRAIALHNLSAAYVTAALEWARRYTGIATQPTVSGYALPLPRDAIGSRERLTQPHHDYPAIDIGVPVGTPVYAITNARVIAASDNSGSCGGTVMLAGDDGATYTYCHLSAVDVVAGTRTSAGSPLGTSGGLPGARGAGNSTGPHLHFGVRVNGVDMCPQAMLLAIAESSTVQINLLTRLGCTTPG
jgi:murein DD-endopeptidase MepM/ murein hydrolase activator NlpD